MVLADQLLREPFSVCTRAQLPPTNPLPSLNPPIHHFTRPTLLQTPYCSSWSLASTTGPSNSLAMPTGSAKHAYSFLPSPLEQPRHLPPGTTRLWFLHFQNGVRLLLRNFLPVLAFTKRAKLRHPICRNYMPSHLTE